MVNKRKLGLFSLAATLSVACADFEAEERGASSEIVGALNAPQDDPAFLDAPEMTFATINIGRTYGSQDDVKDVFEDVRRVIGPKPGPAFIGWQEISEDDPCGDACEYNLVKSVFDEGAGWDNRRPDTVKVPVTAKGVGGVIDARATFASPGEAGVSPTRKVTVVHYEQKNLSMINTHLIAGAWSCPDYKPELRKDYWQRGWSALKEQVKRELDRGRNAIVTGDLNRPRGSNPCNPSWDPTSLHPRAQIIGGSGIDYIFAVPAPGHKFVYGRDGGTVKRGAIHLGIDGHEGHWVRGGFVEESYR